MNKITKIAISTSFIGLFLIGVVIASGAAHPTPFFDYGAGFGMLFLFVSVVLFVVGWVFGLKKAAKQKRWADIAILFTVAALFLSFFLRR